MDFTENEKLQASNLDILRLKLKDSDVHLFESKNHHRNFIDAVLSRGQVATPAAIAQRAVTTCYLGSIAAAVKRPLKFDPVTEKFSDDEANTLLRKPMREEWKV